jgi:hypothetical protein
MSSRARALLLALLVCVLVGSVAAEAAYAAEPGPFFYGREIGGKGEGEKLSETKPTPLSGEAKEGVARVIIASTPIEIVTKSIQAKGVLYNNALQGQIKILQKYSESKLIKPELKECAVKFGETNEIKVEGHLAWKWNGQKKQLEESPKGQKPTILFTAGSLAEGATKLPEETFVDVVFKGGGCGVLAGSFPIKGSIAASLKPANLEEFTSEPTATLPGPQADAFWNGKEAIGTEPKLTTDGSECFWFIILLVLIAIDIATSS